MQARRRQAADEAGWGMTGAAAPRGSPTSPGSRSSTPMPRSSATSCCSGTPRRAGAATTGGDDATTATILAAFAEFDPEQLLAGRPGFVNLTRAFLTGGLPVPFSPQVAVLEVLESVEVDQEVVDGVRGLAAQGFTIALDDFVWSRAAEPLLEVADIVKVDVLGQAWDDVLATVARCRRPGVRLLAERDRGRAGVRAVPRRRLRAVPGLPPGATADAQPRHAEPEPCGRPAAARSAVGAGDHRGRRRAVLRATPR